LVPPIAVHAFIVAAPRRLLVLNKRFVIA